MSDPRVRVDLSPTTQTPCEKCGGATCSSDARCCHECAEIRKIIVCGSRDCSGLPEHILKERQVLLRIARTADSFHHKLYHDEDAGSLSEATWDAWEDLMEALGVEEPPVVEDPLTRITKPLFKTLDGKAFSSEEMYRELVKVRVAHMDWIPFNLGVGELFEVAVENKWVIVESDGRIRVKIEDKPHE